MYAWLIPAIRFRLIERAVSQCNRRLHFIIRCRYIRDDTDTYRYEFRYCRVLMFNTELLYWVMNAFCHQQCAVSRRISRIKPNSLTAVAGATQSGWTIQHSCLNAWENLNECIITLLVTIKVVIALKKSISQSMMVSGNFSRTWW